MKHILSISLLFFVAHLFGQGGYIKPSFIAWPPTGWDSTAHVLTLNPLTGRGYWSPTSTGNDSVAFSADTVCYFLMGDEYCVELDSFYFDVDSSEICFIDIGDTTCLTWEQTSINIFNSNGAQDDATRIYEMGLSQTLQFRRATAPFGTMFHAFRIMPHDNATSVNISSVSTNPAVSTLELNNWSPTGDIFQHWNGQSSQDYNIGIDASANSFIISEGTGLSVPFWTMYSLGDSIVSNKTIQVDAGMLDEDGYGGAVNMVPVCQGGEGQWEWEYPTGGAIPINDLLAADGTNSVNHANYAQEWQWNTLAGSGLKLTSTSTAAATNLQKIVEVNLSGANATSTQSTYSIFSTNTHTGTASTNYAGWFEASGGTTNYALGIRGRVKWDQTGSLRNIFVNGGVEAPTGQDNIGITTTLTANGSFDALTSGENNIALGSGSIFGQLTTGSNNIAIGQSAGPGITTGLANIMIGSVAGQGVSTGDSNVIMGYGASFNGGTGGYDNNTVIGSGAGYLASGTGNVWIGHNVSQSQNANHTLKIDNTSTASPLVFGDFTLNYVKINGALLTIQGADVASAGNMTLGSDGNVFEITGTTTLNRISTNSAILGNGTEVTLLFTTSLTVTDGVVNSGLNIGFELAGNADFSATADDMLTLVLCELGGVQRWREKTRSEN